jgi:transposase
LVLMIAQPTIAARYRETFAPSGAKDDGNDTGSLLDMLLRHPDKLRQLDPDTEETRLIQFLAEDRRRLVDFKTAQCNRLKARLKLYFPQILRWFDNLAAPLVGDLLERWPTLEALQRVNPAKLRKFFTEHNCRNQEKIDERVQEIYAAKAATQEQAVIRAGAVAVRGLVGLIQELRRQIDELEKQLAQLEAEHPDGAIFRSFPGSGDALTPRLIAAFGTRRERWENAEELQCFSGIAPITKASGNSSQQHFRWAAPKFLRQTFHEFAACSIAHSHGREPTMITSAMKIRRGTMPRFGRWPTSGSASCSVAGRSASSMTSRFISARCSGAIRRCPLPGWATRSPSGRRPTDLTNFLLKKA